MPWKKDGLALDGERCMGGFVGGRVLRDLGDGLVLRRSTAGDADALAAFLGHVFGNPDTGEPDAPIMAWTRDLLDGTHPTFPADDFTVVEDVRTGKIVSALCLISQSWTYAGIPFGVGRPELVGTLPEYRRRGLVRQQFEVIHAWSAERGEKVQAITGIPNFYRQFGYEMALSLGGSRSLEKADVPALKDGAAEPFRLRPAARADLPFLASLDQVSAGRSAVAGIRDEALWTYELHGRRPENFHRREWFVVENASGEAVGAVAYGSHLGGDRSVVIRFGELKPGMSWLAVTPSVLRHAVQLGEGLAARSATARFRTLVLDLGPEHPFYEAIGRSRLRASPSYAWYARVADLPDFLRHVAPALDRRLAGSIAAGHHGELTLDFYRGGLRLTLEAGRLTAVEEWRRANGERADGHFPGLTFLQLLFGFRSVDELEHAFPDCQVRSNDARVVLNAWFPKKLSQVWAVA